MIKYTPQRFLAYGIIIYIFLFIFGPYSFELRNVEAISYLLAVYFLWFFGMKCSGIKITKHNSVAQNKAKLELSDFSEYILLFLEFINILAFIVYCIYFMRNVMGGNAAIGDTRKQASEIPFVFKLIQAESYLTVSIYIVVSYATNIRIKFLETLSKIGLFIPAVIVMLSGARWTLFVVLIIFMVVENTKSKHKKLSKAMWIISCSIIVLLLLLCFFFFAVRGLSSTYTSTMPYYGEIDTKYIWQIIGNSGLGKPIYSIFYYFTHSIPYYAQVFEMINIPHIHLGAYMLRIINFFFDSFPSYMGIVNELPCLTGSYSTFVTGYIRDYGFWGTPVMIFVTGIIMGKLHLASSYSALAFRLEPYILAMCILSPIYYIWHVGSIDFMIVTMLALQILLFFTNRVYLKSR